MTDEPNPAEQPTTEPTTEPTAAPGEQPTVRLTPPGEQPTARLTRRPGTPDAADPPVDAPDPDTAQAAVDPAASDPSASDPAPTDPAPTDPVPGSSTEPSAEPAPAGPAASDPTDPAVAVESVVGAADPAGEAVRAPDQAAVAGAPATDLGPSDPVAADLGPSDPVGDSGGAPESPTAPTSVPLPPTTRATDPVPPAGPVPSVDPVDPVDPAASPDPARVARPDVVAVRPGTALAVPASAARGTATDGAGTWWSQLLAWRPSSSGSVLIAVLIALFGFTLVVQLRSGNDDQGLSAARQEDLVRILSDLEAREQRLNADIARLDETQRQLSTGVQGRQAAQAEAERRSEELGLLAGTLPARGPGLIITITPGAGKQIRAAALLNTVQELRGADAEVMQLSGAGGPPVRVVASTSFVDDPNGGVLVGGTRLTGAYQLAVIGSPKTLTPALDIPGGVVATIENAGGTVTTVERDVVEVTATREPTDLQYARPVS